MDTFRSRETLQAWVDEFSRLGYRISDSLRVVAQDGSDGDNTGLVVFTFDHIPLDVYVQPVERGDVHWSATIEPHEQPSELSAVELTNLAAELVSVSALVTYLEAKSAAAGKTDDQPEA